MAYKRVKRLIINDQELIECISQERLESYKRFPKTNKLNDTFEVYIITQQLTSFLFLSIQFLEIVLRNRIHNALLDFFTNHKKAQPLGKPDEWLFWLPQNAKTITIINDAQRFAKKDIRYRKIEIGDIISRLTFGVWVNILSEQPNNQSPQHFWQYTAKKIFPNLAKKNQARVIHSLKEINDIRNRLFHFEPLWDTKKCKGVADIAKQLQRKYKFIIEVIEWMSKDVSKVFDEIGYSKYMADSFSKFITEFSQHYN